jgi:hypothetical protein
MPSHHRFRTLLGPTAPTPTGQGSTDSHHTAMPPQPPLVCLDSASPLPWTAASTTATDWTLHQIAPYIGRMKTSIACNLINEFTRPGDLVVDPFSGSGVVGLEAAAAGRSVLAQDWNPYAVLLSRAKLLSPPSVEDAFKRFNAVWTRSRKVLHDQDLETVPEWVQDFFHPATLRSALALRDVCVQRREYLLFACLLGILHHQRPGFLSYPSSHLVPYLRSKKFPRAVFPEMYTERDVQSRLQAKLARTYRRSPPRFQGSVRVVQGDARKIRPPRGIQAVITSPPYMNELDYVRDNRLRLWFIERQLPDGLELKTRNRLMEFENLMRTVSERLAPAINPGGYFVFVVGDVSRTRVPAENSSDIIHRLFTSRPHLQTFRLVRVYQDTIPDIRRSRRECRGTKAETILVYQREG